MPEEILEEERSAEAGARKFPGWDSRRFNYYEPKGRKATLYEDVTVDVQPDPKRYLLQDWIISFADGTPAYSETRTALRSSDWHRYRAPDEEWERPHYQRQAATERMIQLAVENARAQGALARFDPTWARVLQDHVGALKHMEYGLGMSYMHAQRDGMTQMINNSLLVNASDKLRFAQDLTLYLAEVALDRSDFDEAAGKQHWLNDPVWQGARAAVEHLLAMTDHLEQWFCGNIVLEPFVGELVRSGLVMQVAALQGDFVTPTVVSAGEGDYERNLVNTVELFRDLAADGTYGEKNRQVIGEWLLKFLPKAVEAARTLQPVWSQPRVKSVRFEEAYRRAVERLSATLAAIGVTKPEEVAL